jgi:hypothetical protein
MPRIKIKGARGGLTAHLLFCTYRVPPAITEPVGARLAREKAASLRQADRAIFIAGKVERHPGRSYGPITEPVGARLARDKGASVRQADRAIFIAGKVERHPGRSYGLIAEPVGARLARDKAASVRQADRVIVHREQAPTE